MNAELAWIFTLLRPAGKTDASCAQENQAVRIHRHAWPPCQDKYMMYFNDIQRRI
jgi:hypothetical protein